MSAAQPTEERLAEMIAGLEGQMGLAARDLTTGAELLVEADLLCPTASTMKIILLYALLREADAGQVDLGERVAPTRRQQLVPGSGVLQDLDAGLSLTWRDLATLMIVVSDNAATDMIYERLGGVVVATAIAELGLGSTSLPLTTRAMLYSLIGLDPADPEQSYELARERLRSRERMPDPLALRADPANDVSTPRDMLAAMQAIVEGRGLSAAARETALDILRRQKYTDRIPLRLPPGLLVANKTGSLSGVRGDVAHVEAPGHPFVIAILSRNLKDEIAGARLMAELALVVYRAFVDG